MTGRKPIPSALKAAQGNKAKLGKSRIKVDPKGVGKPTMPPGLNKDARLLWAHVVDSLPSEVLSRADDAVLEIIARAWSRYREAAGKLDTVGLLVLTPQGLRRNPLLAVINQAETVMLKAAAELGLTPAARARLATTAPAPDDTMKVLMGDELASGSWSIPSSASN
ncbi:MAG: phage terminase small subunit P27 family [Mesorhizobium sp.]